ncbi:MAG: LEA type 2 family protein [Leptospiraceae bacterium]|nr:LEA type 2 family protein [Leptospiraceae bacterium]MDW8305899.1 LEA type 2 family protein [Leptospiraceae bacterium]
MRRLWYVWGLTHLVLSCTLLQREAKRLAPSVELLDIRLSKLNFEGVDLLFLYKLTNKAQFPITLNRIDFTIAAEKKQLVSSQLPKGLSVAAKGSTEFEVMHRLKFLDVVNNFLDLAKKDEVIVELKGKTEVFLNQALGSVEVPFEAQKNVPVPKLPSLSFRSLEFKSADFNILNPKASFMLHFIVKNPNSFDAKLASLNYAFRAENNPLLSGALQNINLPAGKEVNLSVPLNLKGGEVISLVPKLRDFEKLSYSFAGDMNLDVVGQVVKIPYQVP